MLHLLQSAGWPIWPLLIAAVIAIAIVVERAWSLQCRKVIPRGLLPRVALGTVVGMIEIFGSQGTTGMSGDPQQLAHGISVALYNTAFGLIVAVPSMIFYRHYRAKVDALAMEMALQARGLIDLIHGEEQT